MTDTVTIPTSALAALLRHCFESRTGSWSVTFTPGELAGDGRTPWAGPSDDGGYTFAMVRPNPQPEQVSDGYRLDREYDEAAADWCDPDKETFVGDMWVKNL